jgi:predicted enzyme related to lactoylglutathione lyase
MRASRRRKRPALQLVRPIFDVPGVGRIAILREPGRTGIGWMTPAQS